MVLIAAGGVLCGIYEGIGLEGKEIDDEDEEYSTLWADQDL